MLKVIWFSLYFMQLFYALFENRVKNFVMRNDYNFSLYIFSCTQCISRTNIELKYYSYNEINV